MAVTDSAGQFEFPVDVEESTDYLAVAPAHDDCPAAASPSVRILSLAQVVASRSDGKVRRGVRVTVSGRVEPNYEESEVVLQWQRGSDWIAAASKVLEGTEFKFRIRARWTGSRRFRVRWLSLDDDRILGVSNSFRVRTVSDDGAARKGLKFRTRTW